MKHIVPILISLSLLAPNLHAAESDGGARPAVDTAPVRVGGLGDLKSVADGQAIGAGIMAFRIGDLSKESRYTDWAADKPNLKAIADITPAAPPFKAGDIRYLIDNQRIMVRIPVGADEKIYGFGLQLDAIEKSGKVLNLNVDHWGKGDGRTHAPVPFYISSKGYGVFFNTARFLKVHSTIGNRKDSTANPPAVDRNPPKGEKTSTPWQATPRGDAIEAAIVGSGLEVIVFGGPSMLDAVRRYNLYCGGGALPPLWGLGVWHRTPASFDAAQVNKEVADYAAQNFPLDVVGLEPGWMSKSYPCTFEWQKKRFPDPAAFTKGLLGQGIRLNLWINPYVSPESRIHKELFPYTGSHLVWLGLVPDFRMAQARKIITDLFQEEHVRIGISGYKVDEVDGYDQWLWPDHATFPSGTTAEVMRQTYGLQLQHLFFNELHRKRNLRTYGNVRASNGGASGYPFVIYSDSYQHAEYITGISAASLCGILWTPEVRSAGNGQEWLSRIQTVCFSPMANLNAWASGAKPWNFPEVTDQVREVMQLRMRLLPYLYSAFGDYHLKGIPPMRAMILDAPSAIRETVVTGTLDGEKDPYASAKNVTTADQFMFGPSILVAPFYQAAASRKGKPATVASTDTARNVILPQGEWFDFHTGKAVGGGKTITVTAAETGGKIPLFVRGGALIPMLKASVNNTAGVYGADLEVRQYGRGDAVFDLYEDDGKTFDYEKGVYRIRRLAVTNGTLSETMSKADGPALFGTVTLKLINPEANQI